jgi:uncharacterized protein YbaR (Trm112 family)
MALDGFLLDLLQDPVDHGTLLYVADENVLYNPRLKVIYEVRDSIPVLLPDESRPASDEEDASFRKNPTARTTGVTPQN